MLGKILIATAVVSGLLIGVIITTTTPSSAGAMGILGVFVLSYTLLVSLISFFIFCFSRFLSRFFVMFLKSSRSEAITLKKAYYYSSVIALAPVIVFSLQSVGGAGIYEVGLTCLFVGLGCMYVAKRAE